MLSAIFDLCLDVANEKIANQSNESEEKRMLQVGVIGCGRIAQTRHLPEYADNADVKLAGVVDLNRERAKEIAQKYQAKAYASYQALLASSSIDAVSVCTFNNTHAEIAIAALNAGKHVLCEKPMATNLEEAEAMVTAAKRNGKFLMIAQNQRLTVAHVRAKQLIEAGEIGTLLTFRTTFGHSGPETWTIDPGKDIWFFDQKRAVMGVMADLGIHKTDLIQYLTGQTVVEATAKLVALDKKNEDGTLIHVDDNAMCIYLLDGGALGTMTASWTYCAKEDNSTVLYGTRGELRIYDDPQHSLVLCQKGKEPVYIDVGAIQTNDGKQSKTGVIDLFADSIAKGDYAPMSGENVISAMRAVFAAIESSKTGRAVSVNR